MPKLSRLFSSFDPSDSDNAQFTKDLRALLDLTDEQAKALLEQFPAFRLARTPNRERQILDELEDLTKLSRLELSQSLNILTFFLDRLLADDVKEETTDTTLKHWVHDLATLNLISRGQQEVLLCRLIPIAQEIAPKFASEIARRQFAGGVLPTLRGCGTTVELRGVLKRPYKWGLEGSQVQYEPEVTDLVGIVSIKLRVDEGEPSSFYFQVEEPELDLLIGSLTAAKKDLAALREFKASTDVGDEATGANAT